MNNKKIRRLSLAQPITLAILILCWHSITQSGLVQPLILPSPASVVTAAKDLVTEKAFLHDILSSTTRVLLAFVLSLAIALPVAVAISESKRVTQVISPYIDFLRYIPVPALIPLAILFFGIGEQAKIFLLFMGTFFQLTLIIVDDIKEIPAEYLQMAKTLGLTRKEKINLKIKAILPQLYDNSRISLGLCWTYLIIAELVASENGIGHVLKESQRFANTPEVYVGIFTMGIIGFLTDFIFKKLYPFFFEYKQTNYIV